MTEWQWAIADLAVFLFEAAFLYYWYFSHKFRNRFLGMRKWLLMSVYPVSAYFLNRVIEELAVRIMILLVIGSIMVVVLYECTFFQSLISHMIFMFLVVVSGSLSTVFLFIVHESGYGVMFSEHSLLRIQCLLLSKLINMILIVFCMKFLNTKKREYSIKEMLVLLLQSFSSLLCLVMIVEFSSYQTEDSFCHMLFLCLLSVVVLTSFIVFYDLIDGYFAYKEREKELLLIEKKNEKILSGYRTLENSQQNVYQLYHDLKKHLSIINVMENKTEIHAYLEKCFENIQDMDGSIQTGNPYIDMFLYNEWKRIHELGIKVQFAVQEGSLEKIELHDLIVILGNALENASEACEKRLEQNGDAYMQLKIIKKEHQVFIILSNNYSGNIEKRGDVYITSKKEKELHGMGMKNISDSIKKYGGDMSISLKNGKFVLKILLDVL